MPENLLTSALIQRALIQRVFLTRKTTKAIYVAYGLQVPWFISLTYLGRIKQFYRIAGIKWPWKV